MTDFLDGTDDDLADVFFTDFIEAGTYNGESIDYIETEFSEHQTSIPGFVLPSKTILVQASDVSQPKAGDVFIDDSGTYRVGAGSMQETRGVWTVPLSKVVSRG
jgi:hypothetical protein